MISISEIALYVGIITGAGSLLYSALERHHERRRADLEFTIKIFENFQRDRQALIDNPQALAFLAKQRNVSEEQIIRNFVGTVDLNRVWAIYQVFNKHSLFLNRKSKKEWAGHVEDMKALFEKEYVQERWNEVQTGYPENFRIFINNKVLPYVNQKFESNEIENSPCNKGLRKHFMPDDFSR
jgi:hypothetical protein